MATIDYGDEINFSIGVTDLDRAVRFFCDHFGFRKLFVDEQNRWAAVATFIEGVTLGFSEVEAAPGRGGATPTFGVADIETVRGELEAEGVKFDGPTIEIPGVTKFATFFDDDGNAFMIAQKLINPDAWNNS